MDLVKSVFTEFSRIARTISSRNQVEVVLSPRQGSSYTDGVKIFLDPLISYYKGDSFIQANGTLDHETAHLRFSKFPEENFKVEKTIVKQLKGRRSRYGRRSRTRQIIKADKKGTKENLQLAQLKKKVMRPIEADKFRHSTPEQNACMQHFEDIRVNRLMDKEFPGCGDNIEAMEMIALKMHLQNFVPSKKVFKYSNLNRTLLAIRVINGLSKKQTKEFNDYFINYYSQDKFVVSFLRDIYFKLKFKERIGELQNTEDSVNFGILFESIFKKYEEKYEKKEEQKQKQNKQSSKNQQKEDDHEDNERSEDRNESNEESNEERNSSGEETDEEDSGESDQDHSGESEESDQGDGSKADDGLSGDENETENGSEDGEEDSEDGDEEDSSGGESRSTKTGSDEDGDEEDDEEDGDEESETQSQSSSGEEVNNEEISSETLEEIASQQQENNTVQKTDQSISDPIDPEEFIKSKTQEINDQFKEENKDHIFAPVSPEVVADDKVFDIEKLFLSGKTEADLGDWYGGTTVELYDMQEANKVYGKIKAEVNEQTRKIISGFLQKFYSKTLDFQYQSEEPNNPYDLVEVAKQFNHDDYKSQFPFIKTEEGERRNIVITILLDISGSMESEDKLPKSISAITAFVEALAKVNIKCEVLAHNSRNSFSSNDNYGRDDSNNLYVIKSFNGNKNENIANIFKLAGSANTDGAAIEYSAQRLLPMEADRKIIFYITDGMPTGYTTYQCGENHMKYLVEEMKKFKIEFYAMGLGAEVTRIYGDKIAFDLNVTDDISTELTRIVTSKI